MLNFWSFILTSGCRFFINAAGIVFLHCFYDTGFIWNRKKFLLFLSGAIVQFGLYLTFPGDTQTTIIDCAFVLIYCFIAVFDYRGKKWSGIWRFLIYSIPIQIMIIAVGDLTSLCFVPEYLETYIQTILITDTPLLNEYEEAVNLFAVKELIVINAIGIVFFAAVFFLLYPMYKKGIFMRSRKWRMWTLLSIAVLTLVLCSIPIEAIAMQDIRVLLFPLVIFALCFVFLFPLFLYLTQVGDYHRKRTEIQEQHIQAELEYFQRYQKTQEETSRFRHDIRNNLLCISEMLQSGKTEEAQAYLQDLVNTSETLRKKYVSGDEMLDCIIGVKAGDMEEQGIRFQLDGVLAGGLQWKPVDICNVFANALDNAIEACQKLAPEKRKITMNIKATPQFWFVTIENPVAETIDTTKLFQKNGGYTSKPNAVHHGIGTYNMKSTVESYGDILKAECNGETFVLEIMIVKSSPV